MDVGVVSYLYMVSILLCPSLLSIHPAGSLFQVSEYLPPLSCGVLGTKTMRVVKVEELLQLKGVVRKEL